MNCYSQKVLSFPGAGVLTKQCGFACLFLFHPLVFVVVTCIITYSRCAGVVLGSVGDLGGPLEPPMSKKIYVSMYYSYVSISLTLTPAPAPPQSVPTWRLPRISVTVITLVSGFHTLTWLLGSLGLVRQFRSLCVGRSHRKNSGLSTADMYRWKLSTQEPCSKSCSIGTVSFTPTCMHRHKMKVLKYETIILKFDIR